MFFVSLKLNLAIIESLFAAFRSLVPLTTDEEDIVRRLFEEKMFYKGDLFLKAGTVCRFLGFIDSGLVRYYNEVGDDEKTFYFGKEADFVCDYQSFLPQKPSSRNIQALEDTRMFIITQERLQRLYQELTNGERLGRLAVERLFVEAIQQINSLYNDPPEVRYRYFLDHYPDIGQRIPQYLVASFIGVQPQSLSRIRKRIRNTH